MNNLTPEQYAQALDAYKRLTLDQQPSPTAMQPGDKTIGQLVAQSQLNANQQAEDQRAKYQPGWQGDVGNYLDNSSDQFKQNLKDTIAGAARGFVGKSEEPNYTKPTVGGMTAGEIGNKVGEYGPLVSGLLKGALMKAKGAGTMIAGGPAGTIIKTGAQSAKEALSNMLSQLAMSTAPQAGAQLANKQIETAVNQVKARDQASLEPPTGTGQPDASGNTVPNANGDMSMDSPTEIVKSEAGITGASAQNQIKNQSNEAGKAISDIFNKRTPITATTQKTKVNDNWINKADRALNPRKAARLDQESQMRDQEIALNDMRMKILSQDSISPEDKARLDLISNTLKEQSQIRVAQAQKHAQGAMSPSQRAAEANPSAVKNFSAVMNNDEPADFDPQQLKTLASMKDLMALFRDPMTGQVDFSRMIGPNAGQQNRQLNSSAKQQPAKKK